MTCEDARLRIHEAHDGGDALPEDVGAHVAQCRDCRELDADLTALTRALRAMPAAPLPPETLDAVWGETIDAKPVAARRAFRPWQLAAAAVVVTTISTATFYFIYAPSRPAGPTPVELARASAQADMVLGYTARALAATREVTADRLLASKVSPAVRGAAAPHSSRRPQ